MARDVNMPRLSTVPGVKPGVVDVELTNVEEINVGNPSAFPLESDPFKYLSYESPNDPIAKEKLNSYYNILSKIMGGTATATDISNLETLTLEIRDYVLTDEDYNLMVKAIQKMQTYILKYMYTDITNKAQAMDIELNKVISDLNAFMVYLEDVYAESPGNMQGDYPIPDGSVLRRKLAADIKESVDYTDAIEGIVVSETKPSNPQGRRFVWYNTGAKR